MSGPDDEQYWDEHPTGGGSGWGGGGGSGGGGSGGGSGGSGISGGWGGGGSGGSGSGSDDGEDDKEGDNSNIENPWIPIVGWNLNNRALLRDSVSMLADGPFLLSGENACMDFLIECQVNDGKSDHVRCILLSFFLDSRDLSYSDAGSFILGGMQNTPCGTITVRAKWQRGHYNLADTHSIRFRIAGRITPWIEFGVGQFTDVAKITVQYGSISAITVKL